ncbi:MAG: hypothetical protein P8Y93_01680 [Acidobacteriota bacterium]
MKRGFFLLGLFVAIWPVAAVGQVAEGLREQVRVREGLLADQVTGLSEVREELREVWGRYDLQAQNLLRAQAEGESVDSLLLREDELRQVEAELHSALAKNQLQLRSMLENRRLIAALADEIRRLSAQVGAGEAPLTGTWHLMVEPDQQGTAYLQQMGTLVTGTYALSGGFSGSFRGTLVAGKVRLERIDSQIGFAAIFYGRLIGEGPNARLQGNWEATQLASGLPSAGSWTGRRIIEEPE